MKIVTVRFGDGAEDRPTVTGWAILSYSDPRGGRTSMGVKIEKQETWAAVATELAVHMGVPVMGWPEAIRVQQKGNAIRLAVPHEMSANNFFAEFNPMLDQSGPHQLSPDFIKIEEDDFA